MMTKVQSVAAEPGKLEGGKRRSVFWRMAPLVLLLIAVGAVYATGLHRTLSFEAFVQYQAWLRDLVLANRWAMLGLYGTVYVAAVSLSLPVSAFLTIMGGYLFGWALGGAAASVAATLGATVIFLVARTSLGQPLLRRAGARIQGLATGFQKRSFSYLLFLRLMPLVPFWLTNLAAAFFGMRLKAYMLATQIGMLPATFAFAFAGSGFDAALAQHERTRAQCIASGHADCAVDFTAKSLLTPKLMIALSALAILALAPIVFRYWRARR